MTGLALDAHAVVVTLERCLTAVLSKGDQCGTSLSQRAPHNANPAPQREHGALIPLLHICFTLIVIVCEQLADPYNLDRCASQEVLCSDVSSSMGHTVSPKDRNKLSINFLSNGSPRAETSPYARHPTSPLSHRARGVNRPESILNNFEDVDVAVAEASSGQSRYCHNVLHTWTSVSC